MTKKKSLTTPELKSLAQQTTMALASALREAGLDVAALSQVLSAASKAPKKALPLVENKIDSAQLGTAFALWHRDPRFTDPRTGLPAPLARTGRAKSMAALMRAAGIKSRSPTWIEFLSRSGLLRQTTTGHYLPRGRSARMPSLNQLHVEHVALGVYHLVRTATKNYSADGLRRPLLQSAAVVRQFPNSQKERFRQFINAQGNAFLANVDDYLESRSKQGARIKVRVKRRTRAGVYAFAFVE